MSSCKKCLKCKYSAKLSTLNKISSYQVENDRFCDYIGKTGHRRPCKPGKDCTVFERRENNADSKRYKPVKT